MLAAIVSFTFVGTAAVASVSSGDMGSGSGNNDMEEMNAYTTISLKKSDGGNDRREESCLKQRGGEMTQQTTMMTTPKTTVTTQ